MVGLPGSLVARDRLSRRPLNQVPSNQVPGDVRQVSLVKEKDDVDASLRVGNLLDGTQRAQTPPGRLATSQKRVLSGLHR
jgi:hypothetical protein